MESLVSRGGGSGAAVGGEGSRGQCGCRRRGVRVVSCNIRDAEITVEMEELK